MDFYALQNGSVSKVVPIDKFSTVLTILLALIILHEGLSKEKLMCILLIAVGTANSYNSGVNHGMAYGRYNG
ncbi:MAG: EamA family transporter [Eubacteriales bacterium]|nr:EamA family transporter [Eubacteriales bacterium]